MSIATLRQHYHLRICREILRVMRPKSAGREYLNFADAGSQISIAIAWALARHLNYPIHEIRREPEADSDSKGPSSNPGDQFEEVTKDFLEQAFALLRHLRPGDFVYSRGLYISSFDQYEHLADLAAVIRRIKEENSELATLLDGVLGGDYVIKPDIVIGRQAVSDDEINQLHQVVDTTDAIAMYTPLRQTNYHQPRMILHASISCKWTLRSDRAQNTRTEALNLIRNRKGPLPHVVAITAEPMPTRIASVAQGTGDLDCVYHFALPELQAAVNECGGESQIETLANLIQGRRLRDISDLPFDLAT